MTDGPLKQAFAIGLVAGVVITSGSVLAQEVVVSDWGSITLVSAGWTVPSIAVYHTAPIKNPGHCPVLNGGYATDPQDSGAQLFNTVALSAFMNRREVQIIVSGCAFGKPRLVGINAR